MNLVERVAFKLDSFIQRLDKNRSNKSSERLNVLDGHIREGALKLEDALEHHVSNQFLLQSDYDQSHQYPWPLLLDLKNIEEDVNSFNQTVTKLKDEYINELRDPLTDQESDDVVPSRIDFGGNKSTNMVVGLSDDVRKIKEMLTSLHQRELQIYSIVGMAGIGKTTLAKQVFEDESISSHFKRRAWVTVSPKYQLKNILRNILVQVSHDHDDEILTIDKDESLEMKMLKSLNGRRYLIVLDDVWDTQLFTHLRHLVRDEGNGSRVLLTTRIRRVACGATRIKPHKMRFLNNEESWDLLSDKIFGDKCNRPHQFERAGKKIAENCEGLPLTIVTVADILSKADKTPEYWNEVAGKQRSSVFVDAYDRMSKVLFPSYKYLPQHLKVWFFYMGVFPQKYEISCSKLTKLLITEKLLEPISSQNASSVPPILQEPLTLDMFAVYCLNELVDTNVVLPRKHNFNGQKIKTCSLHSAFWHLCIKEARTNKFSHVVNSYADGLAVAIKSQRRFCIHNNVLFGIKDVHKSMASVSNVRSLLCTGPYHQYPVPICFGLRLLRILDAVSIHFYEFPLEVLKLVELRYLALTCHDNLPPSIHKLWNLEFLIVHRHLSINFLESPSYLPVEIWDMKELKHLEVTGSNLPDPRDGAFLPKLLTLLDVSTRSCTKGVLKGVPSLKKLGIRIELAPNASDLSFRCFDHISQYLHELKSFKCIIVNPEVILRSEVIVPLAPISTFPTHLTKLSLSGMGYPWEDMRAIASLPNLKVLELRCYAFRGPTWETKESEFLGLQYLLIEDTDLVHWTVDSSSFTSLRNLSLKHCYKLEEFPFESVFLLYTKIEVVECNMILHKAVSLNIHVVV